MSENSELMSTVSQKLRTKEAGIHSTPSKNSTESKGPLNWKEDSSEKDVNLEDITNFINMRKDLLENDFSFKLTRTQEPQSPEVSGRVLEFTSKKKGEMSEQGQSARVGSGMKEKDLDNVFQRVVGDTLLDRQEPSVADTFLKTEDFQLSLTGYKKQDKAKII